MPRLVSDQPSMTASGRPCSRIATPSPSSNHSASSVPPSGGGRPWRCLVRPAGISGARPASSRAWSVVSGAGWWLAIQVAERTVASSCRYAAVVRPSYSTVTLRLPYGLRLSSSVTGGVLMTRNLLTKLRATNPWPRNGTEPPNGAAYPGVAAAKSFYTERSGVPAQPSPSPDRAAGAQAAGPVPVTLAAKPPAGAILIPG